MRVWVRWFGAALLLLAVPVFLSQCSGNKRAENPPVSGAADSTRFTMAAAPGKGAEGFLAYCAMCHGESGAGDGPLAASLRAHGAVVARLDDAARMQALGRHGIRRVVVTGGAHTGRSNLMPAWGERLNKPLVEAIVAYVDSLPFLSPGVPAATVQKYLEAPPGAPDRGRKLFVYYCSGCHGPQGKGDGLNGDTLRVRHGVRPRDLTNTSYFSSKSDQDIYDVIALGGGHMGKSIFMPAWTFQLKPAEIKDLVSYVRVLSRTTARL